MAVGEEGEAGDEGREEMTEGVAVRGTGAKGARRAFSSSASGNGDGITTKSVWPSGRGAGLSASTAVSRCCGSIERFAKRRRCDMGREASRGKVESRALDISVRDI